MKRLRLLSVAACLCALGAAVRAQVSLDALFQQNTDAEQTESLASLSCAELEGELGGCAECYEAGNLWLASVRGARTELIVRDADCAINTTVTCFLQNQLNFREKVSNKLHEKCGKDNPEGYPRRERTGVRGVLPGQYPWRAWVYRADQPAAPMCAATLVDSRRRALLTAASCVADWLDAALHVRFRRGRDRYRPLAVHRVEPHADYDSESGANDIALLYLAASPAAGAAPACVPLQAPRFATPCTAVSADDQAVFQVVAAAELCGAARGAGLLCAALRRDDLEPELGGALLATQIDAEGTERYMLHGLHLRRDAARDYTLNTDIAHHQKWIGERLGE